MRVGEDPPRRLFSSSLDAHLLSIRDGFIAIFTTVEKPPGITNHGNLALALRLDAQGNPLEKVRPAETGTGGTTPTMFFAAKDDAVYIFSAHYYIPSTLMRLPLAVGGRPTAIDFGPPTYAESGHVCHGHGLQATATAVEVLYSCLAVGNDGDFQARWTSIPFGGPPQTLRGSFPRQLAPTGPAVWTGSGWLYLGGDKRNGSLVSLQRQRRLSPRRLGVAPIANGPACSWDGAAAWFGLARSGAAAQLKVTRVTVDGKVREVLAVEVDRAHRPLSPRPLAVASAGSSLLLLWSANEGREAVLWVTRVRPR